MYEINLVPDVKAELLLKQKLRNLVILICMAAGAACVVIVLTLSGVVASQAISLSNQDAEIKCRATGEGNCKGTDTAVSRFENLETLLTMKSQMRDIDILNNNMYSASRIFPLFDVILPDNSNGQGSVQVSQLDADFGAMKFTINASSTDSIGFTAREAFAKGLQYAYYDYGRYKHLVDGEYEDIPVFCITETVKDGYLYGVYHKGKAGCDAKLIVKSGEEATLDEPEDIWIRRSYKNEQDKDSYKEGHDSLAEKGEKTIKGYYFESACIQYDGEGEISEEATIETCPLLDGEVKLESGSYGRSEGNEMVLTFMASFNLSREAFLTVNRHMYFVGPTKKNVTDSYVPVRDIFTEEKVVTEEVK